jgi:hypothetical protein
MAPGLAIADGHLPEARQGDYDCPNLIIGSREHNQASLSCRANDPLRDNPNTLPIYGAVGCVRLPQPGGSSATHRELGRATRLKPQPRQQWTAPIIVTAQRQRSNADGVVHTGWMTDDSALILTTCCDAPQPGRSKFFDSPGVPGRGKAGRIAHVGQAATSIPLAGLDLIAMRDSGRILEHRLL